MYSIFRHPASVTIKATPPRPVLGATKLIRIKFPTTSVNYSRRQYNTETSMTTIHIHTNPEAIYGFDARGIAKRFRHAAIFGALDALQPGETMRFMNDHDPLPLLDQMRNRYGDHVEITYRAREPGQIVIDFVKR